MKIIVFLMILLLIPLSYAQQANQIYGSTGLNVVVNVSSSADIISKGSGASIDYVTVNLTFLPEDDTQQKIISTITSPDAVFSKDSALYTWEKPSKQVAFFLASEVETNNIPLKVTRKVNFPLESVGPYYEYTLPTENIDSDNEEIIRLASEIAAGEDDAFIVVSKIAQWNQENIQYNLSTLTADVSQKASWVLHNRQGVCDELTNLFIAMSRSLGIPARFVSGVSYTDSPLFPEKWGLHGWAEVYFPGVGWVPFDVTYGQYGYVDPSHIKLRSTIDVAEGHTLYSWKGRNIDVMPQELKATADIISINKPADAPISISIDTAHDEIGFGSYNLAEVTVKNLKNYYVSEQITHAKTQGLEIINEKRNVILGPYQEKKEFFLIKVKDDQNRRFIYTYPLLVYSSRNISATSEFQSMESAPIYPKEYFGQISDSEQKTLTSQISLNCSTDKKQYYVDETARILCTIKNNGNVFIQDLNVCLNDCRKANLGITQSAIFEFSKKFDFSGPQKILVTAENNELTQNAVINTVVFDIPTINIASLAHPDAVKYEEEFVVNFLLDKNSSSIPKNTSVTLTFGKYSESWHFADFTDRNITYTMKGSDLKAGANTFLLQITYQDLLGREYSENRSFSIALGQLSLFQKINLFFKNLLG